MKKSHSLVLPRRTFIASGLMVGGTLLGIPRALRSNTQAIQKAKEKLSADEKKWIEDSAIAGDLKRCFGQGYSCAESILFVSLRFLGKPEDLVWAAAGFGGGMRNRDLCGFLTGGFMAIGFASGMLKVPRKEAKKHCGDLVMDYWKWWGNQAPYRCAKIRTEESTSSVCMNLGLLSAAKIEELIEPIKAKI